MREPIRQGDVLLMPVPSLPNGSCGLGTNVIREGEATGHKHALRGQAVLLQAPDGARYVQVHGAAQLVHEDHNPQELEAGVYRVDGEREMDYYQEAVRQVRD